jgi:hypothetical protein
MIRTSLAMVCYLRLHLLILIAFAGLVEGLSVLTEPYTILGGNDLLVQKMFDSSGSAIYLETEVNEITYQGDACILNLPLYDNI